MREKIAFVVGRYGKEINGGAELHCRMLAQRAAERYDIEILTTCIKDMVSKENSYPEGEETVDGILVRRFPVRQPEDGISEKHYIRRLKPIWGIRRFLYTLGILKYISMFDGWGLGYDIKAQERNVFHSEALDRYIIDHKDDYKAIIAITSIFAPFYYTAMLAGEKMIGIPTMHDENASFRNSLRLAVPRIRYMGFNTYAEQKLARRIFGKRLNSNGIISVGIETPEPADWESVRRKFNLPDEYIVYIGRIERYKTGKMLKYYSAYRKKYGQENTPPLVMVGNMTKRKKRYEVPGCVYTGFVSDSEKRSILQHAKVLINPSRYESLSLILLEALYDRVPVLVNGRCNVLKEHSIRSKGAVMQFTSRRSFTGNLHRILTDSTLVGQIRKAGKEYMDANYNWDTIMERLFAVIEKI